MSAYTITKLETSADGSVIRTVISEPAKKRVSKRYRKADRGLNKLLRAARTGLDEFSERHERSRAKKKNGGLKDLRKNAMKASRKGVKKLKLF